MGRSAVKGLFYTCLIIITLILAGAAIVAAFSASASPEDSIIMPLLGLAVPILLICNLVATICWALARKYWALIPLIAFFCNWNYLTSVVQFQSSPKKTSNGKYLKIATYNVHGFGNEITGYSCKEIAKFMEQEQVDVLCFQEFSDNQYFPTDSIRKTLSHWQYELIPTENSSREFLPIAIFSRYPLKNERFITYPESSNCSMMCDVVINSDTVRLINNHLQTTSVSQKRRKWEREMATDDARREVQATKEVAETLHENFVKRAEQTHIIGDLAKKSPYPVMVCGDFNSIPSSYTYHYLSGFLKDGFRTSGNGYMYTYRYGKKLLRIDYIFHSPNLKGISYYSPTQEFCSDHNPVVMEVELL